MKKMKMYLAGQWNEYENNWKEELKKLPNFEFYDPEFDSRQGNPDEFFPDDMAAVRNAEIMVTNPGIAPSEATFIEIGYFYALNTKNPGHFCDKLIIIWKESRQPKWSIEFVKKTGFLVESVEKAKEKLTKMNF